MSDSTPTFKIGGNTGPSLFDRPFAPDPKILNTLLVMGFPRERATDALIETSNKDLASALDWLETHPATEKKAIVNKKEQNPVKYGLTTRGQEKISSRTAKWDKEKNDLREKQRKQAVIEARKAKRARIAEQERVRKQVEADRQARIARNKAKAEGKKEEPKQAPKPTIIPAAVKNHDSCTLQVRLPQGRPLRKTFKSTDTLSTVFAWVKETFKDKEFSLLVPVPRREFTERQDGFLSLQDAKLCPRAALTALATEQKGVVTLGEPEPEPEPEAEPDDMHIMRRGRRVDQGPNTDEMDYEQLLELGNQIGNVSTGLTPEQLAKMPITTYSKEEGSEDAMCIFCHTNFEDGEKIRTLQCGHSFRVDCIDTWLKTKRECPSCRASVI